MNENIQIGVNGMSCAACVGRVERVLGKLPGVDSASVNLATERASVSYDPTRVAIPDLLAAIDEAGYQPAHGRIELRVGGMSCAACVGRVERALQQQSGVLQASVNLATEKATIDYLADVVSPAQLRAAIVDAGYQVVDIGSTSPDGEDPQAREQAEVERLLWICAAFTLPVVLIAMAPMMIKPAIQA